MKKVDDFVYAGAHSKFNKMACVLQRISFW